MIDISQISHVPRAILSKGENGGGDADQNVLKVVVSPNSKEVVCIQCGVFVKNVNRRRKLFHLKSPPEKTQACSNLERIIFAVQNQKAA